MNQAFGNRHVVQLLRPIPDALKIENEKESIIKYYEQTFFCVNWMMWMQKWRQFWNQAFLFRFHSLCMPCSSITYIRILLEVISAAGTHQFHNESRDRRWWDSACVHFYMCRWFSLEFHTLNTLGNWSWQERTIHFSGINTARDFCLSINQKFHKRAFHAENFFQTKLDWIRPIAV